ncbi:MAG: rhomboid family intramembrane serine protease [Erysipelotrichaceae bacterium]|nr:rhomboid family intramembrane serine protease [Erysipelotrichaceae bacterium]
MNRSDLRVTIFFTVINIIVFVLQLLGLISLTSYAIIPALVRQGQIYRIITGSLMHGSYSHIIANLFSFFNIGSYCELRTNRKGYLVAILLSMLTSGLMITFFSNSATVGFSGVVFGVMGYYAILLYKNDGRWDAVEKSTLARMLIPNVIISLMPGVSWAGHLGGFIGGVIAGLLYI